MPELVRVRRKNPWRTLAILVGGALVLLGALVGPAARGDAPLRPWTPPRLTAPADTDSVALDRETLEAVRARFRPAAADTDSVALGGFGLDSLRVLIDSLGADSVRALLDSLGAEEWLAAVDSLAQRDTTDRVRRYLAALWNQERNVASPFPRQRRSLGLGLGNYWKHDLQLDSTRREYVAREQVGSFDVRYPLRLDPDAYERERLALSIDRNWEQLLTQRANRSTRGGGFGLNITVPGGRQSAFTTIFGKNEVDLRVTGQADITAGFDYRKSDRQVTIGTGAQLDPDFRQDLRLGITGTIGDKMKVDVNWDTERDFDYQNQLRLSYTGYDDEILQKLEGGNVFLQTPSTLIRGGQSLFGIKSEWKIGGARVTTVMSTQEGQSNSLSIEGGAEATPFTLDPINYEERTHYFLSYYFRNRWEEALSAPPNVIVDGRFQGITDIEVWKLTQVNPEDENVRQVVAMVDLGEPAEVVELADAFTTPVLPDPDLDQYTPDEIESFLRPGSATPEDFLTSPTQMQVPLTASDYQEGSTFKKLELGRDYVVDETLGYLTLLRSIQDGEALAVAFRYQDGARTVQVGEFSSETGGGDNSQDSDRIVLKLLKPVNLRQPGGDANPAAWYLEMRNIYRLSVGGLQPNEFELEVTYEAPGQPASRTFPEGVGGQKTLLELLGLDRVNESGSPRPDNRFDYLPNYTIMQGEGRLIFPYLEPFGSRVRRVIEATFEDPAEQQTLAERLVFADLYRQKKGNAALNQQLNVYSISGSFKGGTASFYDLKAFSGVVEGSVRVTSGGTTLTEGADYIVDYQGGTVTITNPAYLTAGRNIEIDYEQNALINLQKKTLVGARLDYSTSEQLALGATMMRMSQRSLTDKFRIGEEPISNTIWGVDGNVNLEPRWLTRAIDVLPFLQTREASTVTISGEFAQLLPGHSDTQAFQDTQRDLRNDGRDFKADELNGISYLDDFESFENTYSLMRPGQWFLAAAPATLGEPLEVNNERGLLAWYQLSQNALRDLEPISNNNFDTDLSVGIFRVQSIFPTRQRLSGREQTVNTLDLYVDPQQRGPYNYNEDLGSFIDRPEEAWGGITQRIAEGFTDFTLKNIEFVEFIFRPFPKDGPIDPNARLYVDLGLISEDVIPDNKLNTEDGLSLTEGGPVGTRARLSTSLQDQTINPVPDGERITEDLGLDGLASFPNNKFAGQTGSEEVKFDDFLQSLDNTTSARFPNILAREIAKARLDPSGDDYFNFLDDDFFGNPAFFPNGASVQERFSHFFPGQELNSLEAQQKLGTGERGNASLPDSEDLNLNSTLDTEDSYFEYSMPLSLDSLRFLARRDQVNDYIIEEIGDAGDGGWFLVRIPLKDPARTVVGNLEDFTVIESIRLWTTGHTSPVTLRFAELELVGSQWRKSAQVTGEAVSPLPPPVDEPVPGFGTTELSISSVNSEENQDYLIPQGTIINQIRSADGTRIDAREQALVLRVEDLLPGEQEAIFQTYQGLDLLKYEHLRMFVHMHGRVDGRELEDKVEDRDKVMLFVRLGANETNDFYEYEQPLTPSAIGRDNCGEDTNCRSDYLWRTNQEFLGFDGIDLNSLHIELGKLNQLKFERDENGFPTDSIFWSDNGISNLQEIVGGIEEGFAPPGTRVGIRGTPSLNRINTIVIGVRNPAEPGGPRLDDVQLWVNELRVSGYDEQSGSAALLNADVKLADLGRLKGNFRTQTDGFGSLASTLGERDQTTVTDWALNTQLNLDKFIPERYGWTIPMTVEVKSNTATPRFDPNRGDIRVEELLQAIEADEGLSSDSVSLRKNQIVEQAQTHTFTRSFTSRVQKRGSRSRLLRNTLDGLAVSYSYTDSDGRSPNQAVRDSWRWTSSLNYRLNVRRPRVFRPLGPLQGIPVLKLLSGLQFNYLPNNLSFTAAATRRFSVSQERPNPLRNPFPEAADLDALDAAQTELLTSAVLPLRQQHAFTHNRTFGLQYNPFGFLSLGFDTKTDQSLNEIGARIDSSTVLLDDDGLPLLARDANGNPLSLSQVLRDSTTFLDYTQSDVGTRAFGQEQLRVRPLGNVINDILGGNGPRTDRYESRFNASLRPRIQNISALDWITIQDIGYGAFFTWVNGPVDNNFGATVTSAVDLRGGVTVSPQGLFEKFGFYRKMQEAQRAAEQEAQQRRTARDAERQQRREEKRLEKERQRLEEEARALAEEEGLPLPEEEEEEEEPEAGEAAPPVLPPPATTEEAVAEADSTERGGFRLPLPNPVGLMRQVLLGITGIQDLRITYTGNRNTEITNVGDTTATGDVQVNYSLLDALARGQGPSLGFRLGLDRSIDTTRRVLNESIQVTDALRDSDRIQASTRLRLSTNLQVTLNWGTEWAQQATSTLRLGDNGQATSLITERGTNKSTVWAFQANYLDLFQRQLDRFIDECGAACAGTAPLPTDTLFGATALTNNAVAEDFRNAYLNGLGVARLPFPMPSWTVNYSGIGQWPLIRRITQSASLRHSYRADYSTEYRSNPEGGTEKVFRLQGGGPSLRYLIPNEEIGSARVNEAFQPLIGLDLGFKGNVQTSIAWNKNNAYTLSTTNYAVGETRTSELTLTASYRADRLRLPFLPKLNNSISFSLTVSRSTNEDRTLSISEALSQAATLPDGPRSFDPQEALGSPAVTILSTHTRLTVSPKITYTFSQRVVGSAGINYERFEGDSRRPSTTTINGGFTFSVKIAN